MTASPDAPWWDLAPLRDTRHRDLAELPASAVRNLVDQSLGLARHAVRTQRHHLQNLLGDGEDLDQQLTEWILEAAVTYDPTRGPWAAHVVKRVQQLAADHWRQVVGRAALAKLRRFNDSGGSGVSNRDRLQVSTVLALLPGGQSILDSEATPPDDQTNPDHDIAQRSEQARVSLAVLAAATAASPTHRSRLHRGLAIYLLRNIYGYSQRNLAECGIHHRTAASLENEFRKRLRKLLDVES